MERGKGLNIENMGEYVPTIYPIQVPNRVSSPVDLREPRAALGPDDLLRRADDASNGGNAHLRKNGN